MFHGSDIEQVAKKYGIAEANILNFASNVNPLGLPAGPRAELARNLDIITRYPDRNYTSLKTAISGYTRADPGCITIGNGTTELISLMIRLFAPKKALVIRPTYSEYERELNLVGAELSYYFLTEANDWQLDVTDFIDHLGSEIDMVVLCNPNNPTSSAVPLTDLEPIIAHCRTQGIFLLIDETYVEFAPDVAAISAISLARHYDNFIVLRGVSKFFAAPGLRFGYGITSNAQFLDHLREEQNPWTLNSVGAFLGELMLKDSDYSARTRALITAERRRLSAALAGHLTYRLYPSYGNFFLLKLCREGLTAAGFFDTAIRRGLMIRDCTNITGLDGEFIRFGILKPEQNDRLLELLSEVE